MSCVQVSIMPLLERLKSIFTASNTTVESRRKPNAYNYIKKDEDPGEIWKIVGELGDGSFGKVYKVRHDLNLVQHEALKWHV